MKLELADRLRALYEILLENGYDPKLKVNRTTVTLTMKANYKEAMDVVSLCWEIKKKYGG